MEPRKAERMMRANCSACKDPITLANVLLLTESMMVWECDCGVKTHRDLSDELRSAVCGKLRPRLPYVAAPNPFLPLDDAWEATIMLFGFKLEAMQGVDDFITAGGYPSDTC